MRDCATSPHFLNILNGLFSSPAKKTLKHAFFILPKLSALKYGQSQRKNETHL